MKILKKKMIWFGMVTIAGVILFIVTCMRGGNETAATFGAALSFVGIAKIIQFIRISRDEQRLKKFEIEHHEERLIMIAEKSGRFTLMITIIAELAAAIILMLIGNEMFALWITIAAAVQSVIYLIIYTCLSRKF